MVEQERIKVLISEERIEEAIKESGDNISLLYMVLEHLFEKKKLNNSLIIAEELVDKILEFDPHNVNDHAMYGSVLVKLKRYSDAEFEFYQALKEISIDKEIKHSEVDIKRSEILTDLADMLCVTERYEKAETHYRAAINSNPNPKYTRARESLGKLLIKLGKYKEAEQEYIKLLESDPASSLQFSWGDILYNLGSYEKAKEAYKNAIIHSKDKNKKKLANMHDHLGKALLKLKRYREAEEEFKLAISLNKCHAGVFNNLGVLFIEKGDDEKDETTRKKLYEEALGNFETSLRILSNYAKAHNNSGIVLRKLKRIPEAKECFKRAIDENPKFSDAYTNLGVLYGEELKDNNKAIENFEEAIRLDPNNCKAYSNLILAYMEELKDYDKAIEKFEETIKLDLNNCKAYSKAYFSLALAKLKITKKDNFDWWQTSTRKKISMYSLILFLSFLFLLAFCSVTLSTFNGVQSITETKMITESLSNITVTTTKNSLTNFSQIIVLIGTVALLLCLPNIKKLKVDPSGVEFEMENPREELADNLKNMK